MDVFLCSPHCVFKDTHGAYIESVMTFVAFVCTYEEVLCCMHVDVKGQLVGTQFVSFRHVGPGDQTRFSGLAGSAFTQ